MAISDVAVIAVPIALVGSRIYNVITSPQPYFGRGGNPIAVFEVWKGGLGVPGGVLFGVVTRAGSGPGGTASTPTRWPTSVAPARSRSGRRSAASATISTRNSSAGRRRLPWGLKHRPRPRRLHPRSVDLSADVRSTRSSGTWRISASVSGPSGTFRLKKGQVIAIYVALLLRRPVLDRISADRYRQPPLRPSAQRLCQRRLPDRRPGRLPPARQADRTSPFPTTVHRVADKQRSGLEQSTGPQGRLRWTTAEDRRVGEAGRA